MLKNQLSLPFTRFAFAGFLAGALITTVPVTVSALTLKSGQVLSKDGKIYDGASPEQAENIARNAGKVSFFGESKKVGVSGDNLWVVVDGNVVFVPLKDISGLGKDEVEQVIVDAVIDEIATFDGAAINAGEVTREAWDGINAADLADATKEAANVAAREAASVAAHQAAEAALDEIKTDADFEKALEKAQQDPNFDGHCAECK